MLFRKLLVCCRYIRRYEASEHLVHAFYCVLHGLKTWTAIRLR